MSPKRTAKFWRVINQRQYNLTVIIEDVHDAHNISAILRSCDSIGVFELYVVFTDNVRYCKIGQGDNLLGKRASGKTIKWMEVHYFDTTKACFEAVRKKYDKIYTTHISEDAQDLYDLDLTQSMALVFGNERDGVSDEAVALSDGNFLVPQVGMAQSLNVSVACAVTMYEAYRQRAVKGMYEQVSAPMEIRQAIFDDWKER